MAAARKVSSREHPEPTGEDETAVTRNDGLTERRFPKGTFEQKPLEEKDGSSLSNADTPLLSLPLSYIRSGWYDLYDGAVVNYLQRMFYRNNQSVSKLAAYTLRGTESHIDTQNNQEKGFGFSLRCVRQKIPP